MRLSNIFLKILQKIFHKKCIFLQPCIKHIHRSSKLLVTESFEFNSLWGRTYDNKLVGAFYLNKNSIMEVGRFTAFAGSRILVGENAHLKIGSGAMNHSATIDCFDKITIGNGVIIGENVKIRDSDGHQISYDGKVKSVSAPIEIGNHVWIGMNSIILKGVTIGDGSVIAAGSIVTKDIPSGCLAAGVPARVIRKGVQWK